MTEPANSNAAGERRPYGPHPGAEPKRNPAARWITPLVGLALLALSGVIARELWYIYQDETFTSWLEPVFNFLGTAAADATAVTVGIILSLLGLWLIITAFLPRARTHVRVESPASIWMRPVDIARKATHATRAEVGGENIRSKADRKRLTVEVEDDGSGYVSEQVTATLDRELRRLSNPPAVSVKVLPRPAASQASAQTAAPATPAAEVHELATATTTEVREVTR